MLPFLVNMDRLFELFVAEWLSAHPLPGLSVASQDHAIIGSEGSLRFDIDLVLYDQETGQARCVLDTKYKEDRSSADVAQVVAYATAKDCEEAVLVYPSPLSVPLNVPVGRIQVRGVTFSLAGDLEQAGQDFVDALVGT
jgi:5-methylcytosine-specific restriction enzyme subunit McrC